MGSAHRLHYDLYRAEKVIADPGDAGTITVTEDLQICEMVSVGASETRTLTDPDKPGIRFVLRMKTDGGDITVTAANGLNAALETSAVFADVGDQLFMISVSTAAAYRWDVLVNTGAIAVPSSTPSFTPSATPSHTPSHTPSATA